MKRAAAIVLLLLAAACNRDRAEQQETPTTTTAATSAGNAERGRALAAQYGCNVCHIIPGVEGAQGALGPSLQGVATRPTISYGAVQNTPENMTRYIVNPPALNPQSTMPALGLSPADAGDITAYLFTLK